jgi:putative ABC transport system permease protein
MITLALQMLFGDRGKYWLLLSGIALATLLMTQGLALFFGLMGFFSATVDNVRSPIWVVDPLVEQAADNQPLRDTEVQRVRSVPGVRWAAPIFLGITQARVTGADVVRQIFVVGVETTTLTGAPANLLQGNLVALDDPDAVLVDPQALRMLSAPGRRPLQVGDSFEMNDRTARIVGVCSTKMGQGGAPYVYTTFERAREYVPSPRRVVSFVLATPEPGEDPAALAGRIAAETGLQALTEAEFKNKSTLWALKYSPIPFVVGIIVVLGFLVGTVVSGQTFYTFILENSRHLGVLRAMGASTTRLALMIVAQAATVGVIGYGLGLGGLSLVLMGLPEGRVPLLLLWPVPVVVFIAVLGICILAATLGIWRVAKLEPAIVFRG